MTMMDQGTRSARIPPHSTEAEESVLGSILLSSDAANEVLDRITPEDFYVPAHQAIFEAISRLYNENQPIDAVTVADMLRRAEELDKVGGVNYLTRILDAVPTAANINYYADVVEEHGLRRRMLRASAEIGELALQIDEEIDAVIDTAEQRMLAVAEKRIGEGLEPLGELFKGTLEDLEALESRDSNLTGVSTGLIDLDKKLAGLQKSNLVIIAGRPSMGKCLTGDTRIVDAKSGRLVPIRDLAADAIANHLVPALDDNLRFTPAPVSAAANNGKQMVFEVTTRLGRKVTASANHPLRTLGGWVRLEDLTIGDSIAVPRRLDVFGVERRFDAEVALVGYLLGDGNLTHTSPSLCIGCPTIRIDAEWWAADLGLELTGHDDRRTAPNYRLVVANPVTHEHVAGYAGVSTATAHHVLSESSGAVSQKTRSAVERAAHELGYFGRTNPLTERLDSLGIDGLGSRDKFVPDAYFQLPKDQLALFLNRLYAADGSAWVSGNLYRIEYCTESERLARDVQHLLMRFGIVAKLRERQIPYGGSTRRAFDVSFQDPENVIRFADEIGIFSKEEAVAHVREIAATHRRARSNASLLPMEAWEIVLAEKGYRRWSSISLATGRSANHNWHVGTRRISRWLMAELASALDSGVLHQLAHSDVVWDPIVAIEEAGEQVTYDLEVPTHHNFVANDVVVHNSSLATNIATHVALNHGPIAIFSLEMARTEIVQRLLCSYGRIDSMKLRTGQLGSKWPDLVKAANQLYKAPIYVDDAAQVTVTDIRAKCRRLKRKAGLELIVVDYIQLMQGTNRENRQQEIAEISRNLKNLARELEVPVIGVSQLNRGLESRTDKRPQLGDLRESGAIEQDADVVMFIYRDEYYNPESQERGIADIIISKHRAGATGTVKTTFAAEYTKFANLPHGSTSQLPPPP